jgi:hypothetical protein
VVHTEIVDRYDVITALERRPIGASRACADALRAAAQVVFEKEFATSDLLTMYRNRASREQAGETPTRGLAEAVHDLADSDHDRLHLIGIEATGARYQFLLFVTPAGPDVVACLGRQAPEHEA